MSAKHTFAIPTEVMDILHRCTIDAETIKLPDEDLSRPLYVAVNKVFAAYGGVWKGGKLQYHRFPAGGTDKIKAAMGSGEVQREKVIRQAFYTPDEHAETLVDFACINLERPLILEPSCGDGALLRAIRERWAAAVIRAYEIDEGAAAYARTHCTGPLMVHTQDFLTAKAEPVFDYIVMNPPFQNGQAKLHIAHALKFLRRNGILVSIVPANFTWPEIADEMPLPDGAFKESGTGIALKIIRVIA